MRLAVAGALLAPAVARAEEALPAGFFQYQVNERGQHCEPQAELTDGARRLVACGAAGVWEVAIEAAGPRFLRSYEQPGEATGFMHEPDGRLWVKLRTVVAVPFGAAGAPAGSAPGAVRFPTQGSFEATPAAPQPTAPPSAASQQPASEAAAAAPQPQAGLVKRVEDRFVVITLGRAEGVSHGDRIELSREYVDPDDDNGATSHEVLAVGVVTDAFEHSARVRLGVNEDVPVGSVAIPTRAPTSSSLAGAPRAHDYWSMGVAFRPFFALSRFGGGALLSGWAGRHLGAPFHVQAFFDPLALAAVENDRSISVVNAAVAASYDSRYFEMGLGVGGQTVNSTDFLVQPGSGLSLVQLIRLGALDGLNFTARTSVVIFHSQFGFGGMVANLQIPVTSGYWLNLAGGGGDVGYGYGEVGFRALVAGNGGAGSKFLYVAAGGAGVFESNPNCGFQFDGVFSECTTAYAGPMIAVGGEWRF